MVSKRTTPPTLSDDALAIDAHYSERWSAPLESIRMSRGRIDELPSEFCVQVRRHPDGMMVYATRCMSQPDDESRLELHMFGRSDEVNRDGFVELLTVTAHFHRTVARLGLHHSVNFSAPRCWDADSLCTYGVVSLPYLDGPSLEWLDAPRVRFLWLIPITIEEREFKIAHGMDALEERFEQSGFNFLNPRRPSVILILRATCCWVKEHAHWLRMFNRAGLR